VEWQTADGETLRQDAYAREVSAHGGLLQMLQYPDPGQCFSIINVASGQSTMVRAVAIRHSPQGELLGVGVELLAPSESFWGMTFRIKKASNDLQLLEEALRSGGIDQRVLRDFRDAVDYVRKTAWVVYEWQERQLRHRDTATVLPLLTAERIRRATQLAHSIATDLEAHQISLDSPAIADLLQAFAKIQDRLAGAPRE
jgi:hypothetical protein